MELFGLGVGWGKMGVEPLGGGAYLKEEDLWAVGLEIYHLILSDGLSLLPDPPRCEQAAYCHAGGTTAKSHSPIKQRVRINLPSHMW